ncbi:alpha/beta fold hydrolase [Cupriavidus gilardii]|uniref:Alpha/beta hydrolase n=1 Tax=Cupriavidus gilardii TaxID=82541 RepID=A0A849B9Z2_9BURK|nr:alpha/beta hydrolase [Cupriavidus gilardii]KAB0596101.1 alpha/beta hydrolase [Cupriavidus gilardii]MCT9014014.1 alpha/beta hydrolase [Cupriavidus gilardii]MCT9052202.1 alpha/beta hydrolase [Cupriavidus gilardii]NNH10944.1 alpha/beta hydrolase [Cupriavidus gilardii]WNG70535.1 alpha/beta hydrolase [Cupriavidus gilardii]
MATFVLVHGAFQGGWVWARVAQKLRLAGHDAYTPTLTGLGERAHLANRAIDLDTHIRDIVNVIEYEELNDVILCGHSYGGLVITGVAGEIGHRIRTLFYLDAYAPSEGESLLSINGAAMTEAVIAQASSNNGMIAPIPAAAFNVNAADASWVDSKSVAQPLETFVQPVRFGADSVPVANRTFVYATANGGDWFASTYARLRDDPRWNVHTVECGHNVMLDKPEELVPMLLAQVPA